ncbi:unnamed protein product [Anisakis simplex]|uniref:NTP_transf_2 domain-containing protein n=1 Tax=Anisakis simplex TaxID=6269 RepID=A0A0M3JUC4_ANISI|nr:unnamed protein product [Anisakis simplex]
MTSERHIALAQGQAILEAVRRISAIFFTIYSEIHSLIVSAADNTDNIRPLKSDSDIAVAKVTEDEHYKTFELQKTPSLSVSLSH